MRRPFIAIGLVVLAGAIASQGQVASSPMQLLHPILKDPNKRNAPTSLDRDPSLAGDLNQNQAPRRPRVRVAPVQPAEPPVIVAKIDSGLAASQLSLIGTVNGLKGTIYVTNIEVQDVRPLVQLVVCDLKGFKLGLASKAGPALAPNANEKIVILATNLSATDLKLMRLTAVGAK